MAKTMLAAGYFCKRNELRDYAKNIFKTKNILKEFEFNQELNRNGIWLTEKEKEKRASKTLKTLIDCNLIQNGLIVPGILEYVNEVILWQKTKSC